MIYKINLVQRPKRHLKREKVEMLKCIVTFRAPIWHIECLKHVPQIF